MKKVFKVVENAGYVGESVWQHEFASLHAALNWLEKHYDEDEAAELHVDVALQLENGDLTYDY